MQNYTGYTRINIGGKDRPFYYGVMAARIYCEWKGIEYQEFADVMRKAFSTDTFSPFHATDVIYACLVAGSKYAKAVLKEEEEIDYTEEQVNFWIQEMPADSWKEAGKAIAGANVNPNGSAPEKAEQPMTASA